MGSVFGQIDACIRVIGKITKFMVMVLFNGQMDESTWASTSTTKNTAKEAFTGPTEAALSDTGSLENNMAREST